MKISVIITFYKNKFILYQCLNYLCKAIQNDYEIEVILFNDNPSLSLKEDYNIKKLIHTIKIIDAKQNFGYAGACNIAIRKAKHDVILLLDCDIMVSKNSLNELFATLKENKKIGGVSPVILNMENNTILHYGFATYAIDMIKPLFQQHVNGLPQSIFKNKYSFPTITSGCCMFYKNLYLKVGGMNKRLYNGYCDLDLFYKFYNNGFRNIVCTNVQVYHRGCVSEIVRTAIKTDTKALFCSYWANKYNKEGLNILKKLYKEQLKEHNGSYILFNFSKSLFSNEYIKLLKSILNIEIIYEFKIFNEEKIILEDHISLSLQSSKFSFIYFDDDFRRVVNNHFWFQNRKNLHDLIIDRNGNVIKCDP